MIYKNLTINFLGDAFIDGKELPYLNTRIRNGKIDQLTEPKEILRNAINNEVLQQKIITDSCFYAGNLFTHYGHFLLESLSRLSYFNDEKFIVWSSFNRQKQFTNWQIQILKQLGLENKKHLLINSSCTFEEITVSERGYIIWNKFSPKHRDFLAVVDQKNDKFTGRNVWLSRQGYQTFTNETIIENVLSSHGWLIINPTELSISEQASMFNSANKIVGIEGTAFHTMILSTRPSAEIIVFSRRIRKKKGFNGNFELINEVIGNDQTFVVTDIINGYQANLEQIWEVLGIEVNSTDVLLKKN